MRLRRIAPPPIAVRTGNPSPRPTRLTSPVDRSERTVRCSPLADAPDSRPQPWPRARSSPSPRLLVVRRHHDSQAARRNANGIKSGLLVYFIPKDTQNPYEVIADQGGRRRWPNSAARSSSAAAPRTPRPRRSRRSRRRSRRTRTRSSSPATTPSALCPALGQAQAAGIKVVSFDSDVTCPNHLFINQADTEQIGTSEVDLLAKEINSTGDIAILSAAATATNQNAWIGYMKQQLAKYPNMHLVDTVYGNDDPATSLTVLQGLLIGPPEPARHHLADHRRHLHRRAVPRQAQGPARPTDAHRSRPALADEAVRPRRHGQAVRAVEPERPRLPRRLRGRRISPPARRR